MVRVDRVTPVEGYRLRIGFSDGTERVIDVEPYLRDGRRNAYQTTAADQAPSWNGSLS